MSKAEQVRGKAKKTSALNDSEAARKESYNCFLTFLSGGAKPRKKSKALDAKKKRLQYRFACSYCDKPFRYKCDLKRHERVHTNERPFGCDICGKSFKQRGTLNAHKLHHTGDRPFFCYICGKRFRQKSILLNHYRNHAATEQQQQQSIQRQMLNNNSNNNNNSNANNSNNNNNNNMDSLQLQMAMTNELLVKQLAANSSVTQLDSKSMDTETQLRYLFAGHSCAYCNKDSVEQFKLPNYKKKSRNNNNKIKAKERIEAAAYIDGFLCPVALLRAIQSLETNSYKRIFNNNDNNNQSSPQSSPSQQHQQTLTQDNHDNVEEYLKAAESALIAQINMNNKLKESIRKEAQATVLSLAMKFKYNSTENLTAISSISNETYNNTNNNNTNNNASSANVNSHNINDNNMMQSLQFPNHMPQMTHMENFEYKTASNDPQHPIHHMPFPTQYHPEHSAFMRVPMGPQFQHPVFQNPMSFVSKPLTSGPSNPESYSGPFMVGGDGPQQMMSAVATSTLTQPMTNMFVGQQVIPPHPEQFPSHLPPDTVSHHNLPPQTHYPTDNDTLSNTVLPQR